jgi:superfamily II DNA or RNA helicase
LADEMGLGKTLTVLLAARAIVRCAEVRVLVVAPVGLHPHWRREADAVGLSLQLVSWARLPDALPAAGTLLVVDEAHYAQSMKAQRTGSFAAISAAPEVTGDLDAHRDTHEKWSSITTLSAAGSDRSPHCARSAHV